MDFSYIYFFVIRFCLLNSPHTSSTLEPWYRLTHLEVFLKHQKYFLAHTSNYIVQCFFHSTDSNISFLISSLYQKIECIMFRNVLQSFCTCYITQMFIASDLLSKICGWSPQQSCGSSGLQALCLGVCTWSTSCCWWWWQGHFLSVGVLAQIPQDSMLLHSP